MAKKPKFLERFSNRVILIGSVAASIVAAVGLLTMVGVPLPLTEKSPVIRNFQQDVEIHELDIGVLKFQQKAILRKDALDTIAGLISLLSQFEGKTDLNPLQEKIKGDWEAELLDWTERLKQMTKAQQ